MLHKNHVDIVKFPVDTDVDFKVVISILQSVVNEVRSAKAKLEQVETQGGSDSLTVMLDLTGRFSTEMKERRHEILTWLDAPDPVPQHRRTLSLNQAGTGSWFLEHQSFVSWKQAANSIIWTYGKCLSLCRCLRYCPANLLISAGTGKTVLVFVFRRHHPVHYLITFTRSTVIDDLQKNYRNHADRTALYYYCSFQESSADTLGVVASLVAQLLRAGCALPREAIEVFEAENHRPRQLCDVISLSNVLKALIEGLAHVYILLDALDEFAELGELLKLISHVRGWSLPQLHVLLTSQNHGIIITHFMDDTVLPRDQIDVGASRIHEDIRSYISHFLTQTAELQRRWKGQYEYVLREIESTLVDRADGSYETSIDDISMAN
jgi:hypothetical protein